MKDKKKRKTRERSGWGYPNKMLIKEKHFKSSFVLPLHLISVLISRRVLVHYFIASMVFCDSELVTSFNYKETTFFFVDFFVLFSKWNTFKSGVKSFRVSTSEANETHQESVWVVVCNVSHIVSAETSFLLFSCCFKHNRKPRRHIQKCFYLVVEWMYACSFQLKFQILKDHKEFCSEVYTIITQRIVAKNEYTDI